MKLRWLYRLIGKTFYIETDQVPKVLYHGVLLAFIIAGFWLLDSLKDPVLSNTVGMEYQPVAKLLSVAMTLLVVCIYDFLTSLVGKPMLFHIISVVYCFIMLILSALLSDEKEGLGNARLGPDRYLGWVTYCLVESYGSLTVTLFWSFTNSVMNLEDAKGAYGLIIAIAQIGAILGSTFAAHAATLTIPGLFVLGSVFILSVSLLVKGYHLIFRDYTTQAMRSRVRSVSESSVDPFLPPIESSFEKKVSHSYQEPSPSIFATPVALVTTVFSSLLTAFSGFYEGLFLIAKYSYVLKLFVVSCLYDIVVVILDYEFKITGAKHTIHPELLTEQIVNEGHITDRFANLLGHFGQMTNLISLLLSLCGFSYIVHQIGIQKSLLIFPFTLLIAVIVISFLPNIWVLFFFVSILKGMLFSLHDPAKELLYIPTTEGIKYKAKAWIDVFGSRLAKAAGSMVTFISFGDIQSLRTYSEIPLLVITGIVIYMTWSIGNDFQQLVESHRIVGEEYGDGSPNYDPFHSHPSHHHHQPQGPIIHGVRPGEVGYSGYDPHLFVGVWEEDDDPEDYTYDINDLPERSDEYSHSLMSRYSNYSHVDESSSRMTMENNPRKQRGTFLSVNRNPPVNAEEFFGKTREELFGINQETSSSGSGSGSNIKTNKKGNNSMRDRIGQNLTNDRDRNRITNSSSERNLSFSDPSRRDRNHSSHI